MKKLSTSLKTFTLLASFALALSLGACSSINNLIGSDSGIDYKSSKSAPKLDVPPDFTQAGAAGRASATRVISANASNSGAAPNATSTTGASSNVLPVNTRVRMERNGAQRFLVVDLPAEQVYPALATFWKDNGFTLSTDSPQTGIMETDWAENRANLPASGLRSILGGIFDKVVDSGLRDKFRTRIERVGNSTEVYLTHRGSKEAAAGGALGKEVVTSARDNDVELQSEFLRKMMLRFGADEASAKGALVGQAGAQPTASAARARMSGTQAIELDDSFDAAWRRVGGALDRAGFTIDDRDVTKGEYFVRYARNLGDSDRGFFSKMFSSNSDKLAGARKLKLSLSRAAKPLLTVTDEKGAPAETDISKNMLSVMLEELK